MADQTEELERGIKQAFPSLSSTNTAALTTFLLALLQGKINDANIENYLSSNTLIKETVSQLGVQSIETPQSLIPIQGQTGDVSVGDVAGRDKISIGALTIYTGSQADIPDNESRPSKFSSSKERPSKPRAALLITTIIITIVAVIGFFVYSQTNNRALPANYYDFENELSLQEWESIDGSTVQLSTKATYSGNSSVALTTIAQDGQEGGVGLADWKQPFQADSIIGHVYFPSSNNVAVLWAQICFAYTGYCENIPVHTDTWTAFVVNLYKFEYNGKYLHEVNHSGVWFQVGLRTKEQSEQYTIFIDGIQINR